jgi:hypothetical protein
MFKIIEFVLVVILGMILGSATGVSLILLGFNWQGRPESTNVVEPSVKITYPAPAIFKKFAGTPLSKPVEVIKWDANKTDYIDVTGDKYVIYIGEDGKPHIQCVFDRDKNFILDGDNVNMLTEKQDVISRNASNWMSTYNYHKRGR